MADYSDNFDRTNSATLGANWAALASHDMPGIEGNQPKNPGGAQPPGARWSANSFTDDQYSEVAVIPLTWVGSISAFPAVRCSASANTCYYAKVSSSDDGGGGVDQYWLEIRKIVAGSDTPIGSSATLPNTFNEWVLRVEVVGNAITLKSAATHGGTYTSRISRTDSTPTPIASGSAGFVTDYSYAMAMGDNWYGGDLGPASLTLSLTGLSGTSAQSSFGSGADLAASGLLATAESGTVAASVPGTAALSGVAAALGAGAAASAQALTPVGLVAPTFAGLLTSSVAESVEAALSGLQAEALLGDVSVGIFMRARAGSLVSSLATALAGTTASSFAGTAVGAAYVRPAPIITTSCHLEDAPLEALEGVD